MTQGFLIALGGNRPFGVLQPKDVLLSAIELIRARGLLVEAVSPLFRSPAFPAGSGPDFVNAALVVQSDETPERVLEILHEIEGLHGRTRTARWSERTLDLDLIGAGDAILPNRKIWQDWSELLLEKQMVDVPDQLILPHPRLQERSFVLVPLKTIAPDWRHPVLGTTVAQMCAALPETELKNVVRLADPPCQ